MASRDDWSGWWERGYGAGESGRGAEPGRVGGAIGGAEGGAMGTAGGVQTNQRESAGSRASISSHLSRAELAVDNRRLYLDNMRLWDCLALFRTDPSLTCQGAINAIFTLDDNEYLREFPDTQQLLSIRFPGGAVSHSNELDAVTENTRLRDENMRLHAAVWVLRDNPTLQADSTVAAVFRLNDAQFQRKFHVVGQAAAGILRSHDAFGRGRNNNKVKAMRTHLELGANTSTIQLVKKPLGPRRLSRAQSMSNNRQHKRRSTSGSPSAPLRGRSESVEPMQDFSSNRKPTTPEDVHNFHHDQMRRHPGSHKDLGLGMYASVQDKRRRREEENRTPSEEKAKSRKASCKVSRSPATTRARTNISHSDTDQRLSSSLKSSGRHRTGARPTKCVSFEDPLPVGDSGVTHGESHIDPREILCVDELNGDAGGHGGSAIKKSRSFKDRLKAILDVPIGSRVVENAEKRSSMRAENGVAEENERRDEERRGVEKEMHGGAGEEESVKIGGGKGKPGRRSTSLTPTGGLGGICHKPGFSHTNSQGFSCSDSKNNRRRGSSVGEGRRQNGNAGAASNSNKRHSRCPADDDDSDDVNEDDSDDWDFGESRYSGHLRVPLPTKKSMFQGPHRSSFSREPSKRHKKNVRFSPVLDPRVSLSRLQVTTDEDRANGSGHSFPRTHNHQHLDRNFNRCPDDIPGASTPGNAAGSQEISTTGHIRSSRVRFSNTIAPTVRSRMPEKASITEGCSENSNTPEGSYELGGAKGDRRKHFSSNTTCKDDNDSHSGIACESKDTGNGFRAKTARKPGTSQLSKLRLQNGRFEKARVVEKTCKRDTNPSKYFANLNQGSIKTGILKPFSNDREQCGENRIYEERVTSGVRKKRTRGAYPNSNINNDLNKVVHGCKMDDSEASVYDAKNDQKKRNVNDSALNFRNYSEANKAGGDSNTNKGDSEANGASGDSNENRDNSEAKRAGGDSNVNRGSKPTFMSSFSLRGDVIEEETPESVGKYNLSSQGSQNSSKKGTKFSSEVSVGTRKGRSLNRASYTSSVRSVKTDRVRVSYQHEVIPIAPRRRSQRPKSAGVREMGTLRQANLKHEGHQKLSMLQPGRHYVKPRETPSQPRSVNGTQLTATFSTIPDHKFSTALAWPNRFSKRDALDSMKNSYCSTAFGKSSYGALEQRPQEVYLSTEAAPPRAPAHKPYPHRTYVSVKHFTDRHQRVMPMPSPSVRRGVSETFSFSREKSPSMALVLDEDFQRWMDRRVLISKTGLAGAVSRSGQDNSAPGPYRWQQVQSLRRNLESYPRPKQPKDSIFEQQLLGLTDAEQVSVVGKLKDDNNKPASTQKEARKQLLKGLGGAKYKDVLATMIERDHPNKAWTSYEKEALAKKKNSGAKSTDAESIKAILVKAHQGSKHGLV